MVDTTPNCPSPLPEVSIDWIAGTFHGLSVEEVKEAVAPPDPGWTQLPHGRLGYTHAVTWCGVTVLYSPLDPRMGVHVEVSGQGCRALREFGHVGDGTEGSGRWSPSWSDCLQVWRMLGMTLTRLDVALDDRSGGWSVPQLVQAWRDGLLVSRSNAVQVVERGDVQGRGQGQTLYVGAPSSDVRVRVYDKAAEQQAEGAWVRVELQCRRKRAQALGRMLEAEQVARVVGVVKTYLEVKERGADSNRSRWRTASWWDRFLGGAAKVALACPAGIRTVEQVAAWVGRQVAPSLALLMSYWQEDGPLVELLRQGQARMKTRHQHMLAVALRLKEEAGAANRAWAYCRV